MKATRMKKAASLLLALALLATGLTVPASAADNDTRQVEGGMDNSLFVTEGGDLYGCGDNESKQLGGGVTETFDSGVGYCVTRPQFITDNVSMVAASRFSSRSGSDIKHTLVLKEDGGLYGMGSNARYQLGFAEKDTYPDLRYIMDDVKYIAAGLWSSAAITTNGDLYYWGENKYTEPTLMLTGVKHVEIGYGQMDRALVVALKEDGSVWTMGYTYSGALGDGLQNSSSEEFKKVFDDCIDVSAGFDCVMAVKANGDLYGWGSDLFGNLGLSSSDAASVLTPTYVTSDVKDVECGHGTCFLIKNDNALYGMGWNYMAQMGNRSEENPLAPTKLASDVAQVSAGYHHTLILKTDGSTYGCGGNFHYELGAGFSKYKVYTWVPAGLTASPIIVPGQIAFTDVGAGEYYYDPVVWAVENYITTGATPTTFSPNSTCTRAQILTFLWRANGSPRGGSSFYDYTDVDLMAYYYQAVHWATGKGLIPASGNVYPDAPCTRAMVVEFLWKLAGSPDASGSSFSDVDPNASYAKAVAWAVSAGVTTGTSTSANTFSPNDTCTRGQIVTFLYRAMA